MTPYQYARAVEKNLALSLADDQRMEMARLFRLAIDQGCISFRAALEEIAEEHDAGRHDGLPEPCPAYDDPHKPWLIARAALSGEICPKCGGAWKHDAICADCGFTA